MFLRRLVITLENIRGIRKMVFEAPTKSGVYVLTGVNGCGKSTLMTALAKFGDGNVFKDQFVETPFDSYRQTKIIYHVEWDGDTYDVEYSKPQSYWTHTPKENTLKNINPFKKVIYISTSNTRFFGSNLDKKSTKKMGTEGIDATETLKRGMKRIFKTDRFDSLKYEAIKKVGKGSTNPKRTNKVYYVSTNTGTRFSEQTFSLGERIVLNTLEALEDIKDTSLLLIDEIELALHPVAQARFYDYLKEIAKEKDIMVIISTHSPTLIRYASQRRYLELQKDGFVEVKENCYPSYILRDITIEEEKNFDLLLFVEDEQAKHLLSHIIRSMIKRENCLETYIYQIVRVGGWNETVRLMTEFAEVKPYSDLRVMAFPDKDAEDSIVDLQKKNKKSDVEKRLLELWKKWKLNIFPLHITPELGVTEWLSEESAQRILEQFLEEKLGKQLFRVSEIVSEELSRAIDGKSDREAAKIRLGKFVERLAEKMHDKNIGNLYDMVYMCYVENNYDNIQRYYKRKFAHILGRLRKS